MRDKENIFPDYENILSRKEKENLLKQHGKVIWVMGLSGSGKSTIAAMIEKELHERGYLTQVLDGDNIRSGLNNNLGFSQEDREENIRRIAEVAKLFLNCGLIIIGCFISPTLKAREKARKIIGKDDFLEIYVNTPFLVCESRDVKGLYKMAREGKINNFTGIDSPFEPPVEPFMELDTSQCSIEDGVKQILEKILPLIEYKSEK
ncbi:MAG: adenylyl-sulfate kinase [Bacteroidetes bacterium GWF2_38_335]|nr:MAG: adenylyl-sulfate kinase [Bacteroidetes bacterium GWF2_38_335]OFY79513.1 MAG: adenylyl-sulfate kinase [Bacteroidetes bacterium RIFOXYA12_FULL_38_20]HBS86548.1 adenylyl-sulfate kinase [Bacteroidales bacterium]